MAKTDYKSIDEYHGTFPADVQKRMQAIRDLRKKENEEKEFAPKKKK